jgi:hypothetical protein
MLTDGRWADNRVHGHRQSLHPQARREAITGDPVFAEMLVQSSKSRLLAESWPAKLFTVRHMMYSASERQACRMHADQQEVAHRIARALPRDGSVEPQPGLGGIRGQDTRILTVTGGWREAMVVICRESPGWWLCPSSSSAAGHSAALVMKSMRLLQRSLQNGDLRAMRPSGGESPGSPPPESLP